MIPVATRYLDAIAHLPEGGMLTFHHVPWAEYEQLLEDLGPGYRMRVTCDHGRLEIMSPLPIHERQKEFISRLMHVLTEELGLDLECPGSTTYKQEEAAGAGTGYLFLHPARRAGHRQKSFRPQRGSGS